MNKLVSASWMVVALLVVGITAKAQVRPVPGQSASDQKLSQKLVGKWQVKWDDEENDRSSIGWTIYAPNGMASSRSITKLKDGEINLVLEAKWKIINGVLTTQVTKSSNTKVVKVGSIAREKITNLDSKTLEYTDEDGRKIRELRLPNDPPTKTKSK